MTQPLEDDWFFHYTTAHGLQGILDERGFWATDANYMNDFKEVQLGIGYATEWLHRHQESLTENHGKSLVDMIAINMQVQPGHQSGQRMFICSFSEDGDSLSQWRAYGEEGGYAIGIHGSHLRKKAGQLELLLKPCVYDHDGLNNPIARFLDALQHSGFFARLAAARPDHNSLLQQFCCGVMTNSIILKGKAFKEEREWRLFPGPTFGSDRTFLQEFRIRKDVFVPFIKVPLFPVGKDEAYLRTSENSKMPVLKVVIGPTQFKELARDGLCKMLRQKQDEYVFLSPTHSSASYRSW